MTFLWLVIAYILIVGAIMGVMYWRAGLDPFMDGKPHRRATDRWPPGIKGPGND